MKRITEELALELLIRMGEEERLDPNPFSFQKEMASHCPEADSYTPEVVREESGWTAYVWYIINTPVSREYIRRQLITGLRTKQLAKITADYFILHAQINSRNQSSADHFESI